MKKLALITGSSRGIGLAIARRLAEDGYAVALNGRTRSAEAEAAVRELCVAGYSAAFFAADVGDSAAVDRMATEIADTFGWPDVIVNNAGIAQQKLFHELTDEEWHRMMATHVDGAFYVTRAFLPEMIRRHSGNIVNISSMWGQVGGSCEVHYSAAKAALIGMTKALAKEVGPSGIRVNCVSPGVIDTAMMGGFDAATRTALSEETPLCRLGTPDEVAAAVAFLVSDAASFMTGQVLSPNGGIVL